MKLIKKETSKVIAKEELSEGERRIIMSISEDAYDLIKSEFEIDDKQNTCMSKFELLREISQYEAIEYIDSLLDDCGFDYVLRYMRAICKYNDNAIYFFNDCFSNCINDDYLQYLVIESAEEEKEDEYYSSVQSIKLILDDVIKYIIDRFEAAQKEVRNNE